MTTFEKNLQGYLHEILKTPFMWGTCHEAIENLVIMTFDIWGLFREEKDPRYWLDMYTRIVKERHPNQPSVLPFLHFVFPENRDAFIQELNVIAGLLENHALARYSSC